MTNPYESPRSDSDPMEPPRITGGNVGMFLLGFISSSVITLVGSATTLFLIVPLITEQAFPIAEAFMFVCSPAAFGPICGVSFWALTRERSRPFAIGAVACGVAAFLLFGTCFALAIAVG